MSDLMEPLRDNTDASMDGKLNLETDVSARDHLAAIISGARELIDVEIEFYRARLSYSQQVVKRAGIFGIIAVSFLFAAIVALVLGVLLILSALFSPEAATLIVTTGFVTLAGFFGWLARANMRKLHFPEMSGDKTDEQG